MDPDCNGSPMTVTNNVFVKEPGSAANEIMIGGGLGDVFNHNTFGSSNSDIRFGNPNGCGLSSNETLTNNVLQGGINLTEGQSASGIAQDYNLIPGGGVGVHTINATPQYVGGASPTTFSGFKLVAGSPGTNAASDGNNMGAPISTPSPVSGICHTVTPAGSGSRTGADWNNAYAGIPGSLVRGDTYYFADGSYGSYTFSQAVSGTSVITFKKAQSYDFGRTSDGCSNNISAGWNAGTMGSAQAVFSGQTFGADITTNSSYITWNGNGTQTAPGCGGAPGSTVTSNPPTPSDCGFKFDNSGGADSVVLYNQSGTNLNYSYIEIVGSGSNANDQHEIFGPGTGPTTYLHIYGRNAGCVYFQNGGDTRTISFSYFWGTEVNGSGGGCHGQFSFERGSTSNGTEHHNVYRDITGTAIWTFANDSTTHNNWVFYDNVIFNTVPAASWSPFLSDGVIACINAGTNCTNFVFVQNTIANLPITSSAGINNENTGSYTVQNNLWYNDAFGIGFLPGTGGAFTQDHNSFLASTVGCPSGTANVCNNSASSPFVGGFNFNLSADGTNVNNRVALGSPYTLDANGSTFTTDRGAYQF
jgi:hypothetical protein